MKKIFTLLCLVAGFSQPASAASINALGSLTQANFRLLSEDFGSAFSYKPVTPATPLAGIVGFGFDIGIEASRTDISKSSAALKTASSGTIDLTYIYVPKLHVALGLPFGIDISAFTSSAPSADIKVTGAALRYAIIKGGIAVPAVGIRLATTELSGVNQLAFSTKSADISISKGFAFFTPYIGAGQVWVSSKANVTGVGGVVLDESFTQSKVFVGANFNLGVSNFAFEGDNTGGASTISAKFGLRW